MNQGEECTRCGKCCQNMRPYITVGTRCADGTISCTCSLSRESFQAVISERDLHRMFDRNFSFRYPKACPFLSQEEEDSFTCLIYDSRPVHCRNFRCTKKKEG